MTFRGIIGFLTAVAFFFTLLTPKAAAASPWSLMEDTPKGQVASLKAGDKAPFSGVLLNEVAAAKIQVDKENQEIQCKIKIEKEVGLITAKLNLRLANEIAAKEAAQARVKEMKIIKDDQIKFLSEELIKNQKKNKRDLTGVWVASGVVGGVILTVLAGVALREAGKL